jgi:polyhydroxyalkanoate synthesis repressor PhaR
MPTILCDSRCARSSAPFGGTVRQHMQPVIAETGFAALQKAAMLAESDKSRGVPGMASDKQPVAVKKYANRRLYHTGTSSYVTLEDLADMVRRGEDFVVQDAKTGEDITRSVLTQIIVEQEAKGTNLLPVNFLRQLIGFYGDSLQSVVPKYLDSAMQQFAANQEKLREDFASAFGKAGLPLVEDAVRKNMSLFNDAMRMFNPFPAAAAAKPAEAGGEAPAAGGGRELDFLKMQMAEMQKMLETLTRKKG